MGCDGGTIPKRCELVPEKKKKEVKDKNMNRIARWNTCHLSNKKLATPVVACRKGRLYNKDSVLEHLLNKKNATVCKHIKKIKDVKQLSLKPNPSYKESNFTSLQLQSISQFICPLSGLEMNGKYEFVFIWSCGCVLSKRAFKEVTSQNCGVCGSQFSPEDVITINPDISENEKPKLEKVVSKSKDKIIAAPIAAVSELTNLRLNKKNKSQIYKSLFTSSETKSDVPKDKSLFWISTFSYSV